MLCSQCVLVPARTPFMEAFLVSTGIVALAEIGDKTQLLSLLLAARFRKPWPIVLGILVATLAYHALEDAAGARNTAVTGTQLLRCVRGGSCIASACWLRGRRGARATRCPSKAKRRCADIRSPPEPTAAPRATRARRDGPATW